MHLYNSQKKEKIDILELIKNNKKLKIYLCGPTVYDEIHIGNLRPIIIFDFLIRYLKEKKISHEYIQNITDIDDKIIQKSIELKTKEKEISEKYLDIFLQILKKLNVINPHKFVKVTDQIDEIIEVIKMLIESEYAYKNGEDIVFDISKIKNYCELSGQKLGEMTSKKCEHNFAVWKSTKIGQKFDSPWGTGRPGWHIECFAIIRNIFNDSIDIHGGGVDLKFPHHENENALSHAIFNKKLSTVWVHVGHLMMNNEKMSKSTGKKLLFNDIVDEFQNKDEQSSINNLIRFLFLLNKYQKPTEGNFQIFEYCQKIEKNFRNLFQTSFCYLLNFNNSFLINPNVQINSDFLSFIEDDLNMPQVLTWLFNKEKICLQKLKEKQLIELEHEINNLYFHLKWLGFQFDSFVKEETKEMFDKWNKLREEKKYAEADKIREELKNKGITINK